GLSGGYPYAMSAFTRRSKSALATRCGRALALAVLVVLACGARSAVLSEPSAPRSSLASVLSEARNQPVTPADIKQSCTKSRCRFAHAVAHFDIDASRDRFWGALTNYSEYPRIFHRIKTCKVTKRVGDRVWIESELKPHFFVRQAFN